MNLSAARQRRVDKLRARLDHLALTAGIETRTDANETALWARSLEDIDATLYETKYPEFKGTLFVPVRTVHEGADEYTYRMLDTVGQAELATSWSDDASLVDLKSTETSQKMASYRIDYAYSVQDLRRAALANLPLEQTKAMMARKAIARKIDHVIFHGESAKGIKGLANANNVNTVSPITGSWDDPAEPEEMLDDVLKLVTAPFADSYEIEQLDSVLFATAQFQRLSTTRLGTVSEITVLEFLKKNCPWIKNWESSFQLNTADNAGTGPRIVAYRKDPEVLEALVGPEFEQRPVQERGWTFRIPCHGRCGGVVVRYPGAMRFMDGC